MESGMARTNTKFCYIIGKVVTNYLLYSTSKYTYMYKQKW